MEIIDSLGSAYVNRELEPHIQTIFNGSGAKYVPAHEVIPQVSFQSISNEDLVYDTSYPDLGGYCTVWATWFVDMRMQNIDMSTPDLIESLITYICAYKSTHFMSILGTTSLCTWRDKKRLL